DGSVWCWGQNQFGQLGDGTTVDKSTPVKVSLPGPAAQVSAGGAVTFGAGNLEAHTCAAMKDGSAYCWGLNDFGQLGVGNKTSTTAPQALGLTGIKQIAAGGL